MSAEYEDVPPIPVPEGSNDVEGKYGDDEEYGFPPNIEIVAREVVYARAVIKRVQEKRLKQISRWEDESALVFTVGGGALGKNINRAVVFGVATPYTYEESFETGGKLIHRNAFMVPVYSKSGWYGIVITGVDEEVERASIRMLSRLKDNPVTVWHHTVDEFGNTSPVISVLRWTLKEGEAGHESLFDEYFIRMHLTPLEPEDLNNYFNQVQTKAEGKIEKAEKAEEQDSISEQYIPIAPKKRKRFLR